MQWIEEEESDEAPGWYFGKVENIADGLHTIVYSDQATESIDLTKVHNDHDTFIICIMIG